MRAIKQSDYFSPEAYLEAEKSSLIKHEYHDGEVYAMAGASDEHVTIGINLTSLLRDHLRGTGCRVYGSDMKVQIDAVNRYYYPDVLVSCDQRGRQFKYFKKYPSLIIEVLSEDTEAKDRVQNFEHYRHLETLQEYVLVSQEQQQVEVFQKNESGLWVLHPFKAGDTIKLKSIDGAFDIASFYEDVEFASEVSISKDVE